MELLKVEEIEGSPKFYGQDNGCDDEIACIEDIRYISNELYSGSNVYKSKGWSYCWCLNNEGKVAIAMKQDMVILAWLNSWRDVEEFINGHQPITP
jgi:hypothetical protein